MRALECEELVWWYEFSNTNYQRFKHGGGRVTLDWARTDPHRNSVLFSSVLEVLFCFVARAVRLNKSMVVSLRMRRFADPNQRRRLARELCWWNFGLLGRGVMFQSKASPACISPTDEALLNGWWSRGMARTSHSVVDSNSTRNGSILFTGVYLFGNAAMFGQRKEAARLWVGARRDPQSRFLLQFRWLWLSVSLLAVSLRRGFCLTIM
jgi:hypothetical protein